MKLWLISQHENTGWDTYDSAVVAAETEQQARETHPCAVYPDPWHAWADAHYRDWASSPNGVIVKHIGEALPGTPPGPICSSFNAG
jgi:hypothetical protein